MDAPKQEKEETVKLDLGAGGDARLYMQEEMEQGEILPVAGGWAAVYSHRSPDKETANEDSAAILPFGTDAAVLVVADGIGGLRAGELASGLAIKVVLAEMQRAASEGLSLRETILDSIEKANEAISAMGVGAGTTMAVVEIQGATARPYHVGDTMILVTGQKGKIKLQTVSHSPVGYAVEAGYLDEDEAMEHEERHLLSNMLGIPDMRIEVGQPIDLAPRDTLLIASDGLFDNLQVDEIVERMRKGRLPKVTQTLAEDCLGRMKGADESGFSKPDDLSFIVFRAAPGTSPHLNL